MPRRPGAGKRILVLGGGVSGLTTATVLIEAGHQVTIVAEAFGKGTTSGRAGALWFPYLAEPRHLVLGWAATSYRRFSALASVSGSGVTMVELWELGQGGSRGDPWWAAAIPEGKSRSVPSAAALPRGYDSAFRAEVPRILPTTYLDWLESLLRRQGCQFRTTKVAALADLPSAEFDGIVQCTGLGARELTPDRALVPVRGQMVLVDPPSHADPRVCLAASGALTMTYIFPREDGFALGGTAQEGDTRLEPDLSDSADILHRCAALLPSLRGSRVIRNIVGLRPVRKSGVRLEREDGPGGVPMIHNYGHGGSGFTLSWGCAESVCKLLA